jgi:hypothetical protein
LIPNGTVFSQRLGAIGTVLFLCGAKSMAVGSAMSTQWRLWLPRRSNDESSWNQMCVTLPHVGSSE